MVHLGVLWVRDIMFNGFALFDGGVETCGKVGMISLLEPEDVVESVIGEVPDVGSVGAESILGHDDLEVRMLFPELFEPAPAGVTLTIVLVVPVMLEDGLRRRGRLCHLPR